MQLWATCTCLLMFWLPADLPGVRGQAGQNIFDLLVESKPALAADDFSSWLRGDMGKFPTYSEIPDTSFTCRNTPGPGFYADIETQCQVFRRCDLRGVLSSFLCSNGTLFNQLTLTCDWWYNVDCSKAQSFFSFANSKLYVDSKTPLFDDTPSSNNSLAASKSAWGGPSSTKRRVRHGPRTTPPSG